MCDEVRDERQEPESTRAYRPGRLTPKALPPAEPRSEAELTAAVSRAGVETVSRILPETRFGAMQRIGELMGRPVDEIANWCLAGMPEGQDRREFCDAVEAVEQGARARNALELLATGTGLEKLMRTRLQLSAGSQELSWAELAGLLGTQRWEFLHLRPDVLKLLLLCRLHHLCGVFPELNGGHSAGL